MMISVIIIEFIMVSYRLIILFYHGKFCDIYHSISWPFMKWSGFIMIVFLQNRDIYHGCYGIRRGSSLFNLIITVEIPLILK